MNVARLEVCTGGMLDTHRRTLVSGYSPHRPRSNTKLDVNLVQPIQTLNTLT